jgi:hypothetical protein
MLLNVFGSRLGIAILGLVGNDGLVRLGQFAAVFLFLPMQTALSRMSSQEPPSVLRDIPYLQTALGTF